MGLFKKSLGSLGQVPDMLKQANEMKAQGEALQAQYASMMSGEVDPSALEPIEEIDLDTYARITKTQVEGGLLQEEFEAWLGTQGITPKQCAVASSGWLTRMRENPALSARYGTIYQHTVVD